MVNRAGFLIYRLVAAPPVIHPLLRLYCDAADPGPIAGALSCPGRAPYVPTGAQICGEPGDTNGMPDVFVDGPPQP